MYTGRLALIVLYTVIFVGGLGVMLMSGVIAPPEWVLWGLFIASGNLIYTKVMHNNEVETISLVMAFTLIAIQMLGWPQIALATLLGVGFGEVFLTERAWYKKLYNIAAVTLAGVITEIIYTYSGIGFFTTILGTAIVFDIVLFTFLVPIWLLVAKQSVREVHTSYFETFYTVPLSAGLAFVLIHTTLAFGSMGILFLALGTLAVLKPAYNLPAWMTINALRPKLLR